MSRQEVIAGTTRSSRSLWGSLKVARIYGQYDSRHDDVMEASNRLGFGFYNRYRLHSTLDYVSPMQYEENWATGQPRHASA